MPVVIAMMIFFKLRRTNKNKKRNNSNNQQQQYTIMNNNSIVQEDDDENDNNVDAAALSNNNNSSATRTRTSTTKNNNNKASGKKKTNNNNNNNTNNTNNNNTDNNNKNNKKKKGSAEDEEDHRLGVLRDSWETEDYDEDDSRNYQNYGSLKSKERDVPDFSDEDAYFEETSPSRGGARRARAQSRTADNDEEEDNKNNNNNNNNKSKKKNSSEDKDTLEQEIFIYVCEQQEDHIDPDTFHYVDSVGDGPGKATINGLTTSSYEEAFTKQKEDRYVIRSDKDNYDRELVKLHVDERPGVKVKFWEDCANTKCSGECVVDARIDTKLPSGRVVRRGVNYSYLGRMNEQDCRSFLDAHSCFLLKLIQTPHRLVTETFVNEHGRLYEEEVRRPGVKHMEFVKEGVTCSRCVDNAVQKARDTNGPRTADAPKCIVCSHQFTPDEAGKTSCYCGTPRLSAVNYNSLQQPSWDKTDTVIKCNRCKLAYPQFSPWLSAKEAKSQQHGDISLGGRGAVDIVKVTPSVQLPTHHPSSTGVQTRLTTSSRVSLIPPQQKISLLLFWMLSTRSRMLLMVSSFLKQDLEFNSTTPSMFVLVPFQTCMMFLMF